ncbi:hypothetical protein SYNPS1DRAFT_31958 [Syncephalis pseudoplumigaleata]|uniref:Uncharacterized protein n=1 Tax=Syncephalis pseudoplumigaleata TaxID=1712513 RepID=A0A4P9YRG3_9FUNG|nr:hypothetical protein SYNPS1DRAFT_31958 [Syncephalis pseudoplumigaleata]|eukprot:RKP22446.1 hypothetical protein SYNPS1DRAFT_31958 [Syncephalis pseudoplumigaleata]
MTQVSPRAWPPTSRLRETTPPPSSSSSSSKTDGSSAYSVTDLTPLVVTVVVTEPGMGGDKEEVKLTWIPAPAKTRCTADFEEIDDMMELKYALPEPITGIEHITVEPEIMKLIEFVNRQVGHPSMHVKIPKHAVSANVLPVLHGYFLRFFRLHLNRCRITRMRLDTFYLNENGSINLTETKYGNLSLYILDQLALFACAANGWGLQWRHVHSM